MTVDDIIDGIIEREAGYVLNPADRGGPTKFGITAETLGDWRHLGRPATADEVEDLGEPEARDIYRARYITGPGFDALRSQRLAVLLVDMWVNHGPRRATLIVQKALRLPGDGIFGPQTYAAVNVFDDTKLFNAILAERVRFYGRDITKTPSQAVFAAGWLDRAADFLSPN